MAKHQKQSVIAFKAKLENPQPNMDAAFITFPYDVQEIFGTRAMVKVKATFDGYPYRGILSNMGGDHHVILVRKDVREAIRKKVGESVEVTIEQDLEERTLEVPGDLQKLFDKKRKAAEFFNKLSYTNRKEYVLWITSAKRPETRENRLLKTIEKLQLGLRNPTDKG
jgi:hypothetical protein